VNPLPRFLQSPLLRSVPGVYHAFLGRDPVAGRGRSERMREVFSIPAESVATVTQVHSARVVFFGAPSGQSGPAQRREADALWTDAPGTGVEVRTADCAPVLLAHRTLPFVAAVHAGWRGLSAGIVEETVRALAARYGNGVPEGIVAAVGPCARGCCYEIGEETAEALLRIRGGDRHLRKGPSPGKWTADLQGIALAALAGAGIRRERSEASGICTICSPGFHSFRREKSLTGRQSSFIYKLNHSVASSNLSTGRDIA